MFSKPMRSNLCCTMVAPLYEKKHYWWDAHTLSHLNHDPSKFRMQIKNIKAYSRLTDHYVFELLFFGLVGVEFCSNRLIYNRNSFTLLPLRMLIYGASRSSPTALYRATIQKMELFLTGLST